MGALRTITKAQFAYAVNCGRGSYATSLLTLGAKTSSRFQGFLNEDLGSSETVTRDDTYTSYYASASPVELGKTGTRAFATNQGGAIWQRLAAVPPPEPFGPSDIGGCAITCKRAGMALTICGIATNRGLQLLTVFVRAAKVVVGAGRSK